MIITKFTSGAYTDLSSRNKDEYAFVIVRALTKEEYETPHILNSIWEMMRNSMAKYMYHHLIRVPCHIHIIEYDYEIVPEDGFRALKIEVQVIVDDEQN